MLARGVGNAILGMIKCAIGLIVTLAGITLAVCGRAVACSCLPSSLMSTPRTRAPAVDAVQAEDADGRQRRV